MTKDEVKQQFKHYTVLCRECEGIRRKIQDKREDMHYLQSVVTGGSCARGSDISDKVERVIELMDGLIHHYTDMIMEREQQEQLVMDMLACVDTPEYRNVLFCLYIEKVPLKEIPDRLFISERSIWNYANAAIEQIAARFSADSR